MSPHTHRAGQGSNGKKNSVWSVKYKREQYGRRSRTDLEVWHHDGMPISLDKIARSEPFAGGPYKADISAYSCRMWNELSNRLIHNLSCSLSHVKEAGEESGRWNEASWCRSMHLWPCTCPPVLKTIDYCGVHGWGDNLHYYTGFPVADNYMYYFDSWI